MSKLTFGTRAGEGKGPSSTTASKSFQVAEDIGPRLGEIVRGLDARPRPLVITLNGKPAAVVMSPRAYDRLSEQSRFVESIQQGLADAEDGRVIDDAELGRRLAKRRAARRRKQG